MAQHPDDLDHFGGHETNHEPQAAQEIPGYYRIVARLPNLVVCSDRTSGTAISRWVEAMEPGQWILAFSHAQAEACTCGITMADRCRHWYLKAHRR